MNLTTALLTCLVLAVEPKPEQLTKTRADLASPNAVTRREAIKRLVHSDLSPHMFIEMQAALKDTDGEVRSTAATAIGNLGEMAGPAIPVLITQLQRDPVKEARETAARALGRIGKAIPKDHSVVDPLKKAAAEDADSVTRTVAIGALAMVGVDESGQIAALRKFLAHDDPLVRMKAAHALGMIDRKSTRLNSSHRT